MTRFDVWLLIRKIALGIVITVVPLVILTGALWLTQRAAGNHLHAGQNSSAKETSYAN